jgi:RNA polymerase sigma-70 factor (ECF subfamily)
VVADTPSIAVPAEELQRVELESAFETHRHDVYRWALRFCGGNRAEAEDLTHDVFMRLWTHRGNVEARTDLGGWLYTVTARLAMTRRRYESGWLLRLQQFFKPQKAAPVDEVVAARVATSAALETLKSLPEKERVVVCLELVDGLKQRDIARMLGLTEGYVSKLLKRGRERVRSAGWEVGGEPEAGGSR